MRWSMSWTCVGWGCLFPEFAVYFLDSRGMELSMSWTCVGWGCLLPEFRKDGAVYFLDSRGMGLSMSGLVCNGAFYFLNLDRMEMSTSWTPSGWICLLSGLLSDGAVYFLDSWVMNPCTSWTRKWWGCLLPGALILSFLDGNAVMCCMNASRVSQSRASAAVSRSQLMYVQMHLFSLQLMEQGVRYNIWH